MRKRIELSDIVSVRKTNRPRIGTLDQMRSIVGILAFLIFSVPCLAATSVSRWGITWTFDKDYPAGQFVNGDWWVIGPVQVVKITTDLHAAGFTPTPGEDGSMLNPGTTAKQGYDKRLTSYDTSLNAALPNGKPIDADNPLAVPAGSSLVSMVSWLYRSDKDAEPGIPGFNGGTKAPRPVTRSGAVLTVLAAEPPKDAFRPPYCGSDKTIKFTADKLDRSKLLNLGPVANTPDPAAVLKRVERPWIDHVNQYLGAMVHPSENMPNYGRDLAQTSSDAILLLQVDFNKLPGKPTKDKLLIAMTQYGIDLAGIADNGGGWPANGGHHLGRKWPILFAGVVLNDEHLKSVGQWKTRFQEDEQTFVVTQAEIDATHSDKWKPDDRSKDGLIKYEKEDIGLAEWGIVHTENPYADNKAWTATYRSVNGPVYPSMVLAARLLGQEAAWNHKPLFDYTDRYVEKEQANRLVAKEFSWNMWKAYSPKK